MHQTSVTAHLSNAMRWVVSAKKGAELQCLFLRNVHFFRKKTFYSLYEHIFGTAPGKINITAAKQREFTLQKFKNAEKKHAVRLKDARYVLSQQHPHKIALCRYVSGKYRVPVQSACISMYYPEKR